MRYIRRFNQEPRGAQVLRGFFVVSPVTPKATAVLVFRASLEARSVEPTGWQAI